MEAQAFDKLDALVRRFSQDMIAALANMSIAEIVALQNRTASPSRAPTAARKPTAVAAPRTRKASSSDEDVPDVIASALVAIRKAGEVGLGISAIRDAVGAGVDDKLLRKALRAAVDAGMLYVEGEKRGTKYIAAASDEDDREERNGRTRGDEDDAPFINGADEDVR